jgi:hydroxymethylbilane synthase
MAGAGSLKVATRKSPLALWQAEHVAARLRQVHPGLEVELVPLITQGDRIVDRSLAAIGGKGLFVRELEIALQEERADLAVHSMKDLPGEIPEDLLIAAVLPREDARDALLTHAAARLAELPSGARVGTSSLRRQAQLLAARPDLVMVPLRGNVDTRVRRLDERGLDAVVLASAGLVRLGWKSRITEYLDPGVCLPAVGQGVIGVECRVGDVNTRELLAPLEHGLTRWVLEAERAFAQRLGGSCQSPIAAYASVEGNRLQLEGLVAEPDGSRLYRDSASSGLADAAQLGRQLAERVLAAGADALLERLRAPGNG